MQGISEGKEKVRRWPTEMGTGTQHREVAVTEEELVLVKGRALRKFSPLWGLMFFVVRVWGCFSFFPPILSTHVACGTFALILCR